MNNIQTFGPSDIKWIKNITRYKGDSWAYMEFKLGDTFPLNFSKNPKWYPTNYLKAKPKEIIVLFQTLLETEEYSGGWYVTHLVTPVDNEIVKTDNPTHPYTRMVAVIGINRMLTPINRNEWSFYKCNRGQICQLKTIELRTQIDYSFSQKQNFIWNLFSDLEVSLINNIPDLDKDYSDINGLSVTEGTERTFERIHNVKERNPKIILKAKERAKEQGKFYCEICTFNFETTYPVLGDGFIECHHKQPISIGGIRDTKVEDLAIVCSNCHRMLHRKNIDGNYSTIDELKILIEKTNMIE